MKPVGKRLILKPVKRKLSELIEVKEEVINSGIILFSNNPEFKKGQEVIFYPTRVTHIKVSGEELLIISEKDVEAFYEE